MSDGVKVSGWQSSNIQPSEVIRAAGFAVILASGAAALLPAGNFAIGPVVVGGLMVVVGLLEVMANFLRATGRRAAIAAGVASVGAGLLIILQPATSFLSTVYVFIGWLLLRGLLLSLSAAEVSGPMRRAAMTAAAVDFVLAAVAWTGLTASSLIIALFGPTRPIIADFAWLVAASFVAAGMLLVKAGHSAAGEYQHERHVGHGTVR
jgi:uncharacterized membrane protein HdeD (DUF308 family)